MIQEGDRLPPFRLLDDAGQVVTDADLATGTDSPYRPNAGG